MPSLLRAALDDSDCAITLNWRTSMPDDLVSHVAGDRVWTGDLTRVPFWVYKDPDVLESEQQRLFEGPVWNYLCLETEIPNAGDWRSTYVGAMPVAVAR